MDEEVIKFYASHGIELEKQIASRPAGVSPGQIEAAAEFVFKNRNGMEPIMFAREIRRIARQIDISRYRGTDEIAREAVKEIERFRIENENMRGIVAGALTRFENLGWKLLLVQVILILMVLGVLVGVWK